jgi:hypothetical protein
MRTAGRPQAEAYRPKYPSDILDTVESLRDAQRQIAVCVQAWLEAPLEALGAAEARLLEARAREAELLDLIVWNNRDDVAKRIYKRESRRRQKSDVDNNEHVVQG